MDKKILEVEAVSKNYSGKAALQEVSLAVERGWVYGLLGPNGAGKTTLIRILNRITMPDSGEVRLNGRALTAEAVRAIGYLPEERGLYKKMKVGEQAVFFGMLKGMSRRDAEGAVREWMERLEMGAWWDKKVEELSKGMAQKVQFAITVLHRPELLILDEPFSGFDPVNAEVLKREVLRLRDEGATVVLSTHQMASVEELCDAITLINGGRNVLSGGVADIRRSHGANRWELAYRGEARPAVTQGVTVVGDSESADGERLLTVDLRDEGDLRALIAAANDAVELRGVRRVLPSMESIFIEAVKNNDQIL